MTSDDRMMLLEKAQRLTEDRLLLLEERHTTHSTHIEASLDRIWTELKAISAGGSANCIKHGDRIAALERVAEENKARIAHVAGNKAEKVSLNALYGIVTTVSIAMLVAMLKHYL